MSFFAVLFALLIEQFKPLPRANLVHETLSAWMRWAGRNFDAGRDHHAWVVWSITVIAPALLAWGIHFGIDRFSLILALLWNVAVLYLTLGFRQFSHYFTDIRDALDRGDEDPILFIKVLFIIILRQSTSRAPFSKVTMIYMTTIIVQQATLLTMTAIVCVIPVTAMSHSPISKIVLVPMEIQRSSSMD